MSSTNTDQSDSEFSAFETQSIGEAGMRPQSREAPVANQKRILKLNSTLNSSIMSIIGGMPNEHMHP